MKIRIVLLLLVLFVVPSYAAEAPVTHADMKNAKAPSAAENSIAGMYFWGYGVKRDYVQAMKLWLKAAEKGDAIASFNIGEMYEDGWGVKKDYVEAMKWFRRAAYRGNPNAQRNIGEVYGGGWGVKQDYAEATKWYTRAAGQGDYIAQFTIGDMYTRGEGGLKRDYVQAFMWLSLAATTIKKVPDGDSSTIVESFDPSIAAYAAKQRDAIAAKMTSEQVSQARRLVSAWKPSYFQLFAAAADAADVIEESIAAINFHDYQVARDLLLPLADRGNAQAQEMVGTLYASGQDGANRNYSAAMEWYQTAATQGNTRAQVDIGWMYENGWGVRRDYVEAVKWYQKAADLGNDIAQRNIGGVYAGGWAGVKQDYAAAVKWYTKAANQGDYISQFAIGGMYGQGQGGLKQDHVQAFMWLSLAAAAIRDAAKYDFTIVDNYDASIVQYAAKQRDAIGAKMTPEQISQAQRLADAWKPTPTQHAPP